MTHCPPGSPDDGAHDDLAALDFSVAGDGVAETDLSIALGHYSAVDESGAPGIVATLADTDTDADALPDGEVPTFTVTNPPGTVTVTTYMDGRVQHVDLAPRAVSMTESALGEEIVVIAGLATQNARSAQYTFMLEGMREQGHDNAATRDFLNRDLDLPSPEQARAARAELFTTRYAGDHD